MKIVGVLGQAGSGKDTVGEFLVQECGFYSMAFADALKVFCGWMFDWDAETLWGPSELRNAFDERYPLPAEAGKGFLSPRYALQHLGTEWVRHFNPSGHVDFMLRRVNAVRQRQDVSLDPLFEVLPEDVLSVRYRCPHLSLSGVSCIPSGIYVSDCRFHNEVTALQNIGAKIYRIVRPDAPDNTTTGVADHPSETEQQTISDNELDGVIENNGGLEDLRNKLLALFGARS